MLKSGWFVWGEQGAISIKPSTSLAKQTLLSDEERAKARERIMRGGSQTLDVEEMVACVKEMSDRKLPFRDEE